MSSCACSSLLEPSPALSYILGVYFTDGWIEYRRGAGCLRMAVTDEPYIRSAQEALRSLGIEPTLGSRPPKTVYDKSGRLDPIIGRKTVLTLYAGRMGEFCKFVTQNPDRTVLGLAAEHPLDFVRAVYEGNGGIYRASSRHSLYTLMVACTANEDLRDWLLAWLSGSGFHPRTHLQSPPRPGVQRQVPLHVINLFRKAEIAEFLDLIRPCIKLKPRNG